MRPIQFRLLDENNKIVGYERWYVGQFNMETKKDYYVAQPCWMYSKYLKYWSPDRIDHRYKEQCTNIQDKNLKDIFEGDILKVEWANDHVNFKVEWSEYLYGFCIKSKKHLDDFTQRLSEISEIIGTIHENPELLENK